MNISPMSLVSYRNKINFGNSNSTNPIEDETKSQQNNSPDISFDEALYIKGEVNRAFEAFEEQGVFSVDENDILHVSDDFDFSDDDMVDNQGKFAAKTSIEALNAVALILGLPPEDERKNVPVFVKFQYENYINALVRQLELLGQSQEEPVFDELCAALDTNPEISEDDADNVKALVYSGMQYMPEIIETQKGTIEALKTMSCEVQATLDNISSALNYRFLKMLQKGFEGDAWAIINLLSQDNITMSCEPKITKNNDGTTTYNYANISGMLTVVRNSKNGDYISASRKAFGTKDGHSLQFNKDGSIKRLEYANNIDGSVIVVEQNNNKKTAKVQQIFEGWASERNFIMVDGKLRQTSTRVVLLNK